MPAKTEKTSGVSASRIMRIVIHRAYFVDNAAVFYG